MEQPKVVDPFDAVVGFKFKLFTAVFCLTSIVTCDIVGEHLREKYGDYSASS